jgi:hypothetical protein
LLLWQTSASLLGVVLEEVACTAIQRTRGSGGWIFYAAKLSLVECSLGLRSNTYKKEQIGSRYGDNSNTGGSLTREEFDGVVGPASGKHAHRHTTCKSGVVTAEVLLSWHHALSDGPTACMFGRAGRRTAQLNYYHAEIVALVCLVDSTRI